MLDLLAPLVIAAATVASTLANAAEPIAARQISIPADESGRSLSSMVWYPTESSAEPAKLGENGVFVGIPAVRNAAPRPGSHPLVILSHGYGGSWRNLNWLAGELVGKGYVVAAPNHPGTTSMDRRLEEAGRLWERPRDVSRVIDALSEDASIAGDVDESRVAVIGHSLGGWTAMALAGARFDLDRRRDDCEINTTIAACTVWNRLKVSEEAYGKQRLAAIEPDERVRAVVSLDLGLARGFTPDSLAAVRVPALILAAGTDRANIPARLESGYLAEFLPKATTRYVEIADATHYSFMQLCKPDSNALIEAEAPGESFVCKDGGVRDRQAIHREIADIVISFLVESLATQ